MEQGITKIRTSHMTLYTDHSISLVFLATPTQGNKQTDSCTSIHGHIRVEEKQSCPYMACGSYSLYSLGIIINNKSQRYSEHAYSGDILFLVPHSFRELKALTPVSGVYIWNLHLLL